MRTMIGVGVVVGLSSVAVGNNTAYEDLGSFLGAAGTPIFEDFEGFASGTQVTSLPGISAVNGTSVNGGGVVDVFVTAEQDLPFPMFNGGLPSPDNFLSNNLDSPTFATGEIEFVFDQPTLALGFFVADQSPLDTFNISIFDAAGGLVGSFDSAAGKTLPDSFFGVAGDRAFTSAIIQSNSDVDSWGIDDLYHTPIPAPGAAALFGLGGLALARRRR